METVKGSASNGTITFEIFVQGQIDPNQGEYIIAINSNVDPNTSVNPNEAPGEPTVLEAQAGTYTHWDQEFVYGTDITGSTLVRPNGFIYAYKAINSISGSHTVTFVPIILNTNDFTFIPKTSNGFGTNNALLIRLPIADLSIRGNPSGMNPATVLTPPAAQVYVNFITLDMTRTPQDQLGCCGLNSTGYQLVIPLNQAATYISQLTPNSGKQGPANPNLFIIGGEIIVEPAH